jgi:hypothetical protein
MGRKKGTIEKRESGCSTLQGTTGAVAAFRVEWSYRDWNGSGSRRFAENERKGWLGLFVERVKVLR